LFSAERQYFSEYIDLLLGLLIWLRRSRQAGSEGQRKTNSRYPKRCRKQSNSLLMHLARPFKRQTSGRPPPSADSHISLKVIFDRMRKALEQAKALARAERDKGG
jgi:hypothetical protein